ncbi:MAG: sigma-54 dependent transcriptional regulator, partial [Planctomycetota bacterium]
MAHILVVDDEPRISEMIAYALDSAGHAVDTADSGQAALERMSDRDYAVVITDVVMDDVGGFGVLDAARRRPNPPDVIIITGFGTIDSAVDAMKCGATDYITKPLDVPALVDRVAEIVETRSENGVAGPEGDFAEMVGRSGPMRQLYQLIQQVGPTDSTVMIYGQSGTGKELAARAIHACSRRRTGPFIPVDCGALAETLLQSELFGHVKGAFTGAAGDRAGRFEHAEGGTLFLDEIGDMPAAMQAKLLRALENGEVVRVGSNEPRRVDVRVISATNSDLADRVGRKEFRE